MSNRRDVICFKEGAGGKTFAVRLGTAVDGKKEGTINLYLDAFPAPVDGQYKFSVVPQREKPTGTQQASGAPPRDDLNDEVPW